MAAAAQKFVKNILARQIWVQEVRFYARWSHRRPIKVYTSEDATKKFEVKEQKSEVREVGKNVSETLEGLKPSWARAKNQEEDESKAIKYKIKPKKALKPLVATNQKSKVKLQTDMLETVIDPEGNFIYTKMKNNDQRVGSLMAEVKSKKEKKEKDLMLLEGKRLIKDALLSGCTLKYILYSRVNEIEYLKPFLPKMGAQLYKMPYREMQMWSDLTTNPGVMGIFRVPNVADFAPKAALPITVICDNVREPGNLGSILRVCAAVGCDRVVLTKGCVDVWDSKVLRGAVGAHFKLKICTNFEWDKVDDVVDKEANFFIADNKFVSDVGEKVDELEKIVEGIPVLPYYGVDFRVCKHLVLVVGGETMGVSRDSYNLALSSNGARLNIPLSNEVDSLNVGAALGIIAFEMKKQLLFCK